jgi:DNA-3-methyladenine glycosylase I
VLLRAATLAEAISPTREKVLFSFFLAIFFRVFFFSLSLWSPMKRKANAANIIRCSWANSSPEMTEYHDNNWGIPQYKEKVLFEFLSLEGAQAGLSWRTILSKRAGYQEAFHGFDVKKCAKISEKEVQKIIDDGKVVRNRSKINSVIKNANLVLKIEREEKLAFSDYIWSFLEDYNEKNYQIRDRTPLLGHMGVTNDLADTMAASMKKKGFSYVGPTSMYAFCQAIGMVLDHKKECFQYGKVESRKDLSKPKPAVVKEKKKPAKKKVKKTK